MVGKLPLNLFDIYVTAFGVPVKLHSVRVRVLAENL